MIQAYRNIAVKRILPKVTVGDSGEPHVHAASWAAHRVETAEELPGSLRAKSRIFTIGRRVRTGPPRPAVSESLKRPAPEFDSDIRKFGSHFYADGFIFSRRAIVGHLHVASRLPSLSFHR